MSDFCNFLSQNEALGVGNAQGASLKDPNKDHPSLSFVGKAKRETFWWKRSKFGQRQRAERTVLTHFPGELWKIPALWKAGRAINGFIVSGCFRCVCGMCLPDFGRFSHTEHLFSGSILMILGLAWGGLSRVLALQCALVCPGLCQHQHKELLNHPDFQGTGKISALGTFKSRAEQKGQDGSGADIYTPGVYGTAVTAPSYMDI